MSVYELIIGFSYNKCRKGFILCTDGDFVSPSEFKRSDKVAYGYAINNHTVARLIRSSVHFTWTEAMRYCSSNSGHLPNMYELINLSISGVGQVYLPDMYGLIELYNSVTSGDLRKCISKLMSECEEGESVMYCNYYPSLTNWGDVWSSSVSLDDTYAMILNGKGIMYSLTTSSYLGSGYVIPFYKF